MSHGRKGVNICEDVDESKSLSDPKRYRSVVLPNGLKCMLVSVEKWSAPGDVRDGSGEASEVIGSGRTRTPKATPKNRHGSSRYSLSSVGSTPCGPHLHVSDLLTPSNKNSTRPGFQRFRQCGIEEEELEYGNPDGEHDAVDCQGEISDGEEEGRARVSLTSLALSPRKPNGERPLSLGRSTGLGAGALVRPMSMSAISAAAAIASPSSRHGSSGGSHALLGQQNQATLAFPQSPTAKQVFKTSNGGHRSVPSTNKAEEESLRKPTLDMSQVGLARDETPLAAAEKIPTSARSASLGANGIASISMAVGAGSFHEPDSCPGLAHFLEHMLFMGSQKYPADNAFDAFLARNGGTSNAYTDAERTVFHFSCFQKDLSQALDIFAHIFVDPLLSKDAVDREVNAIDSEFSMRQNIDDCRFYEIWRDTSRPHTPFAKFCCGNEETLKYGPAIDGIDIYEELRTFHDRYYVAPNMRLVVIGYDTLDNLQNMIIEMFSGVRDASVASLTCDKENVAPEISAAGAPWRSGDPRVAKRLATLGVWETLLEPDLEDECNDTICPGVRGASLGCLFRISPIKEGHTLNLSWQLPPQLNKAGFYVYEYLGHLFGHESAGSILAQLKCKGWATQLDCNCSPRVGGFENNTACTLFSIQIQLTSFGLRDWKFVVGVVYEYVGMLEREGPQKWVFDEMKHMHAIRYRYKEEEDYNDYAVDLSVKMLPHSGVSSECVLDSVSTVQWAPQMVSDTLNHLRPELARVDFRSHIFWSLNSKKKVPGGSKGRHRAKGGYHSLLDLGPSARKATEIYMDNTYHAERIPDGTIKLWNDLRERKMTVISMNNSAFQIPAGARGGSNARLSHGGLATSHQELHLPPRNPFIPENFTVFERNEIASLCNSTSHTTNLSDLVGRNVSLETHVVNGYSPTIGDRPVLLMQAFAGTARGKKFVADYLGATDTLGKTVWCSGRVYEQRGSLALIGYGRGLFRWHRLNRLNALNDAAKSGSQGEGGDMQRVLDRKKFSFFTADGEIKVHKLKHSANDAKTPTEKHKRSKMRQVFRALSRSSISSSFATDDRTDKHSSTLLAPERFRAKLMSHMAQKGRQSDIDNDFVQAGKNAIWASFDANQNYGAAAPRVRNFPALAPGSDELFKLWIMPDSANLVPRTECYFRIVSPLPASMPLFTVLNDLLGAMLFEHLRNSSYLAFLADLQFEVDTDYEGIVLHVAGFSDKLLLFLKTVFQALAEISQGSPHFAPDSRRTSEGEDGSRQLSDAGVDNAFCVHDAAFDAHLETLAQQYSNDASHFQSRGSVSSAMHKILVNGSWHPSALTSATTLVSKVDDVTDYAALLTRKCRVEGLFCGNVEVAQAERLVSELKTCLKDEWASTALPSGIVPKRRVLSVPISKPDSEGRAAGNPWHAVTGLVHPLEALDYEGHSADFYFQLGPDTLHNRVLAEAIEHFMREPLYTQLRARQQIGYLAHCATVSVLGVLGFVIELTSSSHAPHLLAGILDAFLTEFRDVLAAMSPLAFQESCCAMARAKADIKQGLASQAENLWETISLQRYHSPSTLVWRSASDEIDALRHWISPGHVLEAYDKWLYPLSKVRRRASVLVFGTTFQGDPFQYLKKRKQWVTVVDSDFIYERPEWVPKECVPRKMATKQLNESLSVSGREKSSASVTSHSSANKGKCTLQ